MAGYLVSDSRKVTTHRFIEMKQRGEKISMLTSYDFTTAGIVDGAGIDGILIGDSASNVMAGNHTTLPMTVDQMIYHARSVVRAVKRALVVCDMPFGSYQVDRKEGIKKFAPRKRPRLRNCYLMPSYWLKQVVLLWFWKKFLPRLLRK